MTESENEIRRSDGRLDRWHQPAIRCIICNFKPPPSKTGGIRWKLLAKHYEEHISNEFNQRETSR